MICPNCSKEIASNSYKCLHCGVTLHEEVPEGDSVGGNVDFNQLEQNGSGSSMAIFGGPTHPWRRNFARSVDIAIFSLVTSLLCALFLIRYYPVYLSRAINVMSNPYVAPPLFFLIWIPFEALFISRSDTTPGKWLLGISVTRKNGSRVDFSTAFKRCSDVLRRGLGYWLPVITIFTTYFAYKRLVETGTTMWDETYQTKVRHTDIGNARVILLIVVFVAIGFLGYFRHSFFYVLRFRH